MTGITAEIGVMIGTGKAPKAAKAGGISTPFALQRVPEYSTPQSPFDFVMIVPQPHSERTRAIVKIRRKSASRAILVLGV